MYCLYVCLCRCLYVILCMLVYAGCEGAGSFAGGWSSLSYRRVVKIYWNQWEQRRASQRRAEEQRSKAEEDTRGGEEQNRGAKQNSKNTNGQKKADGKKATTAHDRKDQKRQEQHQHQTRDKKTHTTTRPSKERAFSCSFKTLGIVFFQGAGRRAPRHLLRENALGSLQNYHVISWVRGGGSAQNGSYGVAKPSGYGDCSDDSGMHRW